MHSRFFFVAIFIFAIQFSFARPAHAGSKKLDSCEGDLTSAFQRAPNDSLVNGWQGLVTDQVPLNASNLVAGYRRGLFVFADEAGMGRWYNPPNRGILTLRKDLREHFGRRNLRWIRSRLESGELRVTFDQAFERVMQECRDLPREGGWITDTHIREYTKLHEASLAHSVEVWRGDELVGGLYLVFVDGVASGESMFQHEPKAMMVAYHALIERLLRHGHEFIDTQMNIGLTQLLRGENIPRFEFMQKLRRAQAAHRPY